MNIIRRPMIKSLEYILKYGESESDRKWKIGQALGSSRINVGIKK